MLRVTVELVPGGDEKRKEKIASLDITNLGMVDKGLYDYAATFWTHDYMQYAETSRRVFVGKHRRSRPVWELIYSCIEKMRESYTPKRKTPSP